MNAVKFFLQVFYKKKCAFSLVSLLNGTIFAERERERLDPVKIITTGTLHVVAFWCVHTLKNHSRNMAFTPCYGCFCFLEHEE